MNTNHNTRPRVKPGVTKPSVMARSFLAMPHPFPVTPHPSPVIPHPSPVTPHPFPVIPHSLPVIPHLMRNLLLFLLPALFALTSCVKDELFDTPHPDHGKVTVTADWNARGEGIAVPEKWTVNIGGYTGEESTATHSPDFLFTPGDYSIIAYNQVEGITVSGTMASVASDNGNSGCISGSPGVLFTHVQDVTIEKDRVHEFTAAMLQQTGSLTLMIEPTGDAADRIESIEGSLSGVAGTMDFATDTYGAPSDVALHFTKITGGGNAGKWTATVWLLGVTGNTQRLSATITYTDGNPQPTSLESDLTSALAGFNNDKSEALTLGGTLVETPDEAGFSATITGWEEGESDNGVAE